MTTNTTELQLLDLQARICQAMADPKRLRLLYLLGDGERSVGELAEELGVSMANVSQHLAILRARGLVRAQRTGTTILYRVADAAILDACCTLRGVLIRQLSEHERLAAAFAATL